METVSRRLYERVAAGDLEGAMGLWAPGAADGAAFRTRLAGTLRVRCVEVRDINVSRVEIDGERATADVEVSLVKWSRHSALMSPETELATLSFARDAAGRWLLTGWKRQEETLADALLAAKSDQERRNAVQTHHELMTPELNRILDRRADEAMNRELWAEGAAIARVMETVAYLRRAQ